MNRNGDDQDVYIAADYRGRGGLLADEMGLGKTLSMLSAIMMSREEAHNFQSGFGSCSLPAIGMPVKTTLIVVPSTRKLCVLA